MEESFGEYIKKLRTLKGLSSRELSRRSGVSHSYLSLLETGKRGTPTPDKIKSLATPLNIPYELLLEKAGYLDNNLEDKLKEWNLFGQKLMEQEYSLDEIMKSIQNNIEIYGK